MIWSWMSRIRYGWTYLTKINNTVASSTFFNPSFNNATLLRTLTTESTELGQWK